MLHTDSANLTDAERVDELIFQAMSAQDAYLQMDQQSIDWIVSNMARAGAAKHLFLAKKAVAETGRGIVEDVSVTNIFASSGLEQKLKNVKTVGIVEDNKISGQQLLAEPVGILASIPASEHPTATVLSQTILSVKTRNPIIFCFRSSVQSSSLAAAQLMQEAATDAGAPPFAIQWLSVSSEKSISALSKNPEISLILMDENDCATESQQPFPEIPILGMGQVNTPCLIDRSADIEQAATDVIASKHFDNGLISTSEQTVIISREVYFQTLDLLMQKSCHLTSEQEKDLLEELLFDPETGVANPDCAGRDAVQLAKMAGFNVPKDTKLLLTEIGGIGVDFPLSRSKAVPVLSILAAESWYEGLCFCEAVLEFSSSTHTAVLHARDKNLAEEFSTKLRVTHTILNRPASCGDVCELITTTRNNITSAEDKQAGNPTTALLSVDMLLSCKLVQNAQIRLREWKIPEKILFSPGCINHLQALTGTERTLIVTEKNLMDNSHMDTVLKQLNSQSYPVQTDFFCETPALPTIDAIENGVRCMEQFRPTAILVIGDGATIEIAKAMRYFYQRPKSSFSHSSLNLHEADFPECQTKPPARQVSLISVPTTLAAGTEMYASVTIFDGNRDKRRTLHSCELLPDVTLVDSQLFPPADAKDFAVTGMTILSHAFEAYVSPLASDYSDSMAMKAILLIFSSLSKATLQNQSVARDKVYNAASLAGMAVSNAKPGLNHAMVNSLGSMFRIPHGLANSLLLPRTIRYNGVENPSRFNPLMPGSRYIAHERYHDIARALGYDTNDPEKAVKFLVKEIINLQKELNLPLKVREFDISKEDYLVKVEQMAEQAFEDNSTVTNPRLPLIKEIVEMYNDLY
ncbi:MAG TPA: iron-containing alcohol dehydrogenase [Desulfocapsa sulfexigens]|nr:iron-containing alcohol dehydrogenase [Desulfocapsa sulfexigens]